MSDRPAPFWNRVYVLFLLVNTIAFLGFQTLPPILPIYAMRFGATESQIGFLAASVSFSALLIRPISGLLADRSDGRRLVLIVQLVTAGVVAGFTFLPNILALIASRFFHGLLFGLCSTMVMTAVVRAIPEARMGRGIGLLSLSSIGSQAVAPALGIAISERLGYPALFSVASVLAAIAGFLVLAVKAQPVPKADADAARRRISLADLFAFESLGLTVIVLFFTTAPSTITNFLVIFGKDWGIEGTGYYFTIYASVLIVVRGFCGA